MLAITAQPSLDQIYGFINKVGRYPVSVGQLLNFAKNIKAPRKIWQFYERFPQDYVFIDREELLSRSEQVEIMKSEAADMPSDGLSVAGED